MKSRAELNAIADEDILFKERLAIADELIMTSKALGELHKLLSRCTANDERENVQRLIDEGSDDLRKLGERLLFVAGAPTATGNA
jgi:hypothetical protein